MRFVIRGLVALQLFSTFGIGVGVATQDLNDDRLPTRRRNGIESPIDSRASRTNKAEGDRHGEDERLARSLTGVDSCPVGQEKISIDFDKAPDGSSVAGGTFIESQWSTFGIDIYGIRFASTGVQDEGNWARIFDSSKPTGGDRDLGSPNKNCNGCTLSTCPGFSRRRDAGFLVANVTNCVAQNNILIIHEGGTEDEPDDVSGGGYFDIKFKLGITKFLSIELMDMDHGLIGSRIELLDGEVEALFVHPIDGLGDNTVQKETISYQVESPIIKRVRIRLAKSGAITSLSFCLPPTQTPVPTPYFDPTPYPTPTRRLIYGYVFEDTDNDGEGELPIVGSLVELYAPSGVLLESTETDSNGWFFFTDVAATPGLVVLQHNLAGYIDVNDSDGNSGPTSLSEILVDTSEGDKTDLFFYDEVGSASPSGFPSEALQNSVRFIRHRIRHTTVEQSLELFWKTRTTTEKENNRL